MNELSPLLAARAYWVVPGKLMAGAYPGDSDPLKAAAKIGALHAAGVHHIVNLMEPDETDHSGHLFRSYAEPCERWGISITRWPIQDVSAPTAALMREILDDIDHAIAADRPVFVHSWGGRGRTGTVIGCWLIENEYASPFTYKERLKSLRADCADAAKPSPEAHGQYELVESWLPSGIYPSQGPAPWSRIRGCLLGGAIGDALGNPIEFATLNEIRSKYGPRGLTDLVSTEVTDDTQMTLFTAEGLIRVDNRIRWKGIGSPPAMVWRAYKRWFHTQKLTPLDEEDDSGWLIRQEWLFHQRAPGNTCMSAMHNNVMGTRETPLPNNSKGCGTVMRAAPCGLVWKKNAGVDAYALGADTGALTHGHPAGWAAAGALAVIVNQLMQGVSVAQAAHRTISLLESDVAPAEAELVLPALRAAVVAAADGPSHDGVARLGAGWVAEEALAISVYCALTASSFQDGVLLAVNHDGDSDSTGAITGNILGTHLGESAIPKDWCSKVEGRATIEEIAGDIWAHFWSKTPFDPYGHDADGERYPGW